MGPCRQGTQSCTDGQWETTCGGEITPSPETCNFVDDDCDGAIDEELGTTSCGTGPCVNTIQSCIGGAIQSCEPLCDGVSCTLASQCATGFCKDGRCCDTACTSPCNTCAAGTCTTITNGQDDPECNGESTCDGAGYCLKANGQNCGNANECVSGFCKDGSCCNSSCTAACSSCASGSCSTIANGDDNPECMGAYSCNAGLCQAKSPFYLNSFETVGDFSEWFAWHNCKTDETWYVKRAQVAAPNGGAWGLRLHTTTFEPACSYPGAYALSPPIPATAGATYRVESLCRNSSSVGKLRLIFFDAAEVQLAGSVAVTWTTDSWTYVPNPSLIAVAPANTASLQLRFALASPSAFVDCDLLAIYLDP